MMKNNFKKSRNSLSVGRLVFAAFFAIVVILVTTTTLYNRQKLYSVRNELCNMQQISADIEKEIQALELEKISRLRRCSLQKRITKLGGKFEPIKTQHVHLLSKSTLEMGELQPTIAFAK